MSCYVVMSHHVMLCHAMPCYVMSHHVMSCHGEWYSGSHNLSRTECGARRRLVWSDGDDNVSM